jgi:DNA-binding HxlR family transcriptional regulator
MKRTRTDKAECPVARALDVIGDWWSLLIVRDAFDGVRRFGDFQRSLGVAKGILTTRLRSLVEAGVLEQYPSAPGSAYLDYRLTEVGRGLFPVIVGLRQWGEAHLYAQGEPHSRLTDREGRPVGPLILPSADNKPLRWDETVVRKAPVPD